MNKYAKQYKEVLQKMMDEVMETQMENIDRAASLMADAIEKRNGVFGFAPMHAGMVIEELVYRAGGLAVFNHIVSPALQYDHVPIYRTTEFERLPGHATILLKNSKIKPGDVLLLHACAGRSAIVVEMAMKAKEMGVHVVGIYSSKYAGKMTSLDPSGTMMQDHCEILIDNCGVMGDACIHVGNMVQAVAPTSTVIGTYIANTLVILICDKLLAKGIEPPVYRSANLDGGLEYNAKIMEEYKDLIHYI
jgi:uncharacterized phosphosugar-binding protein